MTSRVPCGCTKSASRFVMLKSIGTTKCNKKRKFESYNIPISELIERLFEDEKQSNRVHYF